MAGLRELVDDIIASDGQQGMNSISGGYMYAPGAVPQGPPDRPLTIGPGYHNVSGGYEAYREYRVPPTVHLNQPITDIAYRSFLDPYGQMSVQPLVGFASRYPHVLSGVAQNPFYASMGMMSGIMPFMRLPYMWGMGGGMTPPRQQPQPRRASPAPSRPASPG